MNPIRRGAILAMLPATMWWALPAHAADALQVTFVAPEKFTDAAYDARELQQVQAELQRHLERLAARHLAQGRTMTIDVLDIDRAGTLRPHRHGMDMVRVMRGTTDWPILKLRYVLRDGERVLSQGEVKLQDMSYLARIAPYGSSDPLRHEKRLLDRWFIERLAEPAAAG